MLASLRAELLVLRKSRVAGALVLALALTLVRRRDVVSGARSRSARLERARLFAARPFPARLLTYPLSLIHTSHSITSAS